MAVSQYRQDGDEIDITVISAQGQAADMDILKNLPISTSTGHNYPLSEVAAFSLSTGAVQIDRENQNRQATDSCDLRGRDLNSVTQDIRTQIAARVQLPSEYAID
jgi:Cu/Ag efflux pump CusA